jgi:DNA-binding PadR family transcriptional regulator
MSVANLDDWLSPKEQEVLDAMPKNWPVPDELFGLQIANRVSAKRGKGQAEMSLGSLYPLLRRLVRKGYLYERWGEDTFPENDGACRKYYRISEKGRRIQRKLQENARQSDQHYIGELIPNLA